MMLDADNLDVNPLFRALQTHFVKDFKWVQQKRGIACIPHSTSICHDMIDQHFVEMHLLQPSPFLKDHFIRPGLHEDFCVALENNFLITLNGYPKPSRRVKILSEELGYNEKSESFRILLIEGPLVGQKRREVSSVLPVMLKEFTVEESKDFLASCFKDSEVLDVLDSDVRKFKSTYLMLSGYLDDAASRIKRIWTDVTKLCAKKLSASLADDMLLMKNIQIAIECCIIGDLYDVIWPVVCKQSCSEEKRFTDKCESLRGFSDQQFTSHQCDLSSPRRQLDRLNKCKSPREKLVCMKLVLDMLSFAANRSLSSGATQSSVPCLTSDDYISLLVSTIISHGGHDLMSNFCFIDKFIMLSDTSDHLSFSLVTFQAASQFMSSLPAIQVQPRAKHVLQPESPINSQNEIISGKSERTSSPADVELERINRVLMHSIRIIDEMKKESTTDFISSLSLPAYSSEQSHPS